MVKEGESEGGQANPTYFKWILEAIGKVKHQKQRPNLERITSAVRQFHKVSNESITEHLELAAKEGVVLKVFNKGICSYRDPSVVTQLKTRTLVINKNTDLIKVIVRSVRELNEATGSTLRKIVNYVQNSYSIELKEGVDLTEQLKLYLLKGIKSEYLAKDGRFIKLGEKLMDSDTTGSSSNSVSFDEDSNSDLSFSFEEKKVKTI